MGGVLSYPRLSLRNPCTVEDSAEREEADAKTLALPLGYPRHPPLKPKAGLNGAPVKFQEVVVHPFFSGDSVCDEQIDFPEETVGLSPSCPFDGTWSRVS